MDVRKFNTKAELDKTHRDEIAAFPIVWAFSKPDLVEGAKKVWDLDIDLDTKEGLPSLISIGAGGYILKRIRTLTSVC